MKKIKVCDCICHGQLVDHCQIKNRMLSAIEKDICNEKSEAPYPVEDRVSKLDWSKGDDFTRPWVQTFLPNFKLTAGKYIKEMGYGQMTLKRVWYQQYKQGDTHGWHTHGDNYTGVYYLEFPKGSSRTEILSPLNFKKHIIKPVEGDLVLFPSHWVHRGPPNDSQRKTIVSFNFNIDYL